jgi:hypothetical protein
MSYADTKPLVAVPPPAPSYPAEVGSTAPLAPHQGMVWLDSSGPSLKVYDNGVWVAVGGSTLDHLSDVNFSRHAPTHGDTLVYDPYSNTWHAGAAPAHITHWGSATNYAEGANVFYSGGIFEANRATIGDSPDFRYGDASFYKRANKNGTGQFQGPFQFEAVNIVVDPTIAPVTVPTTQQPHYTLQYKDDATWAVWHWDLQIPPGYRPGIDPLPTYQWHNLSATYNPAKTVGWRAWSAPGSAIGDFCLWIVDNPRGATQPHTRQIVWNLLEIRKDVASLHDVIARNPSTGDTLVYLDDQNYHALPRVVAAPATPTSPGVKGQTAIDATHVYLCADKDTWVRVARDTTGGW